MIRINIKINVIYIFKELNDKMENFNRILQTIKKSNENSRNRNTIQKFFKLMSLRADWIQLERDIINRNCVCVYVHTEAQNIMLKRRQT